MSRQRKVLLVVLLVFGLGAAGGAMIWVIVDPLKVGRELVGDWEVGSWGEPKVDIQGAPAEIAGDLADQFGSMFRPTEQTRFERNGKVRLLANILGVEITQEGTWTARRAEDDQLVVTGQIRKMTVRKPDGEIEEPPWDKTLEWVVTVLDADRLRVSMVSEKGTPQESNWRRIKQ
jgi:hypothetical protein